MFIYSFVKRCAFIFEKLDTNLCAVRVMHTSKTVVDKEHLKEITEKIKTMEIALDNKLNCLVEILYHKSCYKDFLNKYNQKPLVKSHREVSL